LYYFGFIEASDKDQLADKYIRKGVQAGAACGQCGRWWFSASDSNDKQFAYKCFEAERNFIWIAFLNATGQGVPKDLAKAKRALADGVAAGKIDSALSLKMTNAIDQGPSKSFDIDEPRLNTPKWFIAVTPAEAYDATWDFIDYFGLLVFRLEVNNLTHRRSILKNSTQARNKHFEFLLRHYELSERLEGGCKDSFFEQHVLADARDGLIDWLDYAPDDDINSVAVPDSDWVKESSLALDRLYQRKLAEAKNAKNVDCGENAVRLEDAQLAWKAFRKAAMGYFSSGGCPHTGKDLPKALAYVENKIIEQRFDQLERIHFK
jgi:hypothetical protein